MSRRTSVLNIFGGFICVAVALAPARAHACEFMFHNPPPGLTAIILGAVAVWSSSYIAATGFAANGLAQLCKQSSPALKAAGVAAGAALATEWATHNVQSIPSSLHKTIG